MFIFIFYIFKGWINPENIQKYRSGVHISMVQFDKPSGRGNSGVHRDFKEGCNITADNLYNNNNNNNNNNNSNGFNSMNNSMKNSNINNDNKSMTSRQSNYKNVPTDQMRSMASMMMMGKNTITTSIPISDWKDLKYSKNNSQTFFSTPGKVVQSEDLKKNEIKNGMENLSENLKKEDESDLAENIINATQHLTISNNNKKMNMNNENKNENKNENYSMKSACVTTDFSMQNVLMQMGLNVISVDGMLIR